MNPGVDSPAVEVSIDIGARPKQIFGYLSTPEGLSQVLESKVEMEPKVGGALRIGFQDCKTMVVGKLLEIVPDQKIAFTWGVEEGEQKETIPPGSTTVTITLEATADGTRVKLGHEGLPDEKERLDHRDGWMQYLSQLARLTIEGCVGEVLEATLATYTLAWNETDGERRMELLKQCWDDAADFTDRYCQIQGRDALNQYIGGIQAMIPGFAIEMTGSPKISRTYIAFEWIGKDRDGKAFASGTDFGEIGLDGRIRKIVGFWNP